MDSDNLSFGHNGRVFGTVFYYFVVCSSKIHKREPSLAHAQYVKHPSADDWCHSILCTSPAAVSGIIIIIIMGLAVRYIILWVNRHYLNVVWKTSLGSKEFPISLITWEQVQIIVSAPYSNQSNCKWNNSFDAFTDSFWD